MKFELTRASELNTAKWAGGTTTQLSIYPPGTEYGKFNFTFRISYATVEVPSSTFTFMPGVTRHLMILEGKLKIDHTDRYKKELAPFDQDVFDGEWPTTAQGMVKDFNLMTRSGAEGKLSSIHLKANENFVFSLKNECDYSAIYLQNGSLTIEADNAVFEMTKGDFLLADHEKRSCPELFLHAKTECDIVVAIIMLDK